MTRFMSLMGVGVSLLSANIGWATHSALVESKATAVGKTGVTVGIYIRNDSDLVALVIPLEIRSITPGAFTANSITMTARGRLAPFEGEGAMTVKRFHGRHGVYPEATSCIRDTAGNVWSPFDSAADFVSPDAVAYMGVGFDPEVNFLAGDDGVPGSGSPSLLLTFDVTSVPGTFEIDTTCVARDNHLLLVYQESGEVPPVPIVPAFTKGVITIGCACDCHTDPICDAALDILDLFAVRNVAFGMHDPYLDPNPMCPFEDTDVNCDGVTNVVDVTKMVDVVLRGYDPAVVFCVPCP